MNIFLISLQQVHSYQSIYFLKIENEIEDKGDASGYSLSLGKFDGNDTLTVNQTMVNPYTYTIFYVTAEPLDDLDPNLADVVVAANLPMPFGQ